MQAYLCAGLGDGTKVVDHVCLRHAHTGVAYNEHFILLIRDDSDVKLLLGLEGSRVCQRRITNFIERVRSVRDQFTKENLFVGIESVYCTGSECTDIIQEDILTDDQVEQLTDFSLESEAFGGHF